MDPASLDHSRNLAGLIGPTLIVLAVTEGMNMHIYDEQIAPVVYLNGMILFVVGLAIIRAHNRWRFGWPLLVTLAGWGALVMGLLRTIWPDAPQAEATPATYAVLATLTAMGVVLSIAAYTPTKHPPS